jgi:hypothetical protein
MTSSVLLKIKNISDGCTAYIFKGKNVYQSTKALEVGSKTETVNVASCMNLVVFLLGSVFDSEDGGSTFP